jgi:hypothetical protein
VRDLSATLKAAAKSLDRVPLGELLLEDETLRFTRIVDNASAVSDTNCDAVASGSGIVLAAFTPGDTSITVRVAAVSNFTDARAWRGAILQFAAHKAGEPRLWATGTGTVRLLYVRSDGAVCYLESANHGLAWGGEQNTGLSVSAGVESCVVGMTAYRDLWLGERVAVGSHHRTEVRRSTYDGTWRPWKTVRSVESGDPGELYVPAFDVVSLEGPALDVPNRLVGTVPLDEWGQVGSFRWEGFASPTNLLTAVEAGEEPTARLQGGALSYFAGRVWYTGTLFLSDSQGGYLNKMVVYWWTEDGRHWAGPYYVRLRGQSQDEASRAVLVHQGDYVYCVHANRVYRAPAPHYINAAATPVSLTDRLLQWNLSLPDNAAGQAQTVLANGDGALDSAAYLREGVRLWRRAGYTTASGAELVQLSTELVDSVAWDYKENENSVTVVSRDNLKLLQDYRHQADYDLLSQERLHSRFPRVESEEADDTELPATVSDLTFMSGSFLPAEGLNPPRDPATDWGLYAVDCTTRSWGFLPLSGLASRWDGVFTGRFHCGPVPSAVGLLLRHAPEPGGSDINGENGYAFLLTAERDDTTQARPKLYRCRDRVWEWQNPMATGEPVPWTEGDSYYLRVWALGGRFWCYISTDGLAWTTVGEGVTEEAPLLTGSLGVSMEPLYTRTKLAFDLTYSDTTNLNLPLGAAARFASSGSVIVDGEIIGYTSVVTGVGETFDQLLGLSRGLAGTVAVGHSKDAPVAQYVPWVARCSEVVAGDGALDLTLEDHLKWQVVRAGATPRFDDAWREDFSGPTLGAHWAAAQALGTWTVAEGTLRAAYSGAEAAIMSYESLGDFVLDWSMALPSAGETGLLLRASDRDPRLGGSVAVGVGTTAVTLYERTLTTMTPKARVSLPQALPPGVLLPFRISVQGAFVSLWCNGMLLATFWSDALEQHFTGPGYLGLWRDLFGGASFRSLRRAELGELIDALPITSGQTAMQCIEQVLGNRVVRVVAEWDGAVHIGTFAMHKSDGTASAFEEGLLLLGKSRNDQQWASWIRVDGAEDWLDWVRMGAVSGVDLGRLRFERLSNPDLVNVADMQRWAALIIERKMATVETYEFKAPACLALEREDLVYVTNPRVNGATQTILIATDITYEASPGVFDMTVGARRNI